MSPCLRRTQWPSLRSIAGISSMADGGGDEAVGEAAAAGLSASGFQCRKLRYRARPWSALFSGWNWVAKILSRATRAGKARAVLGFADAVARVRRPRVDSCARNRSSWRRARRPQRVRLRPGAPGSSPSAAPCSGCRRAAAGPRARSARTSPGIRPRPRRVLLLAAVAAASACRRTRPSAACCAAASSTAACRPESRSSRMQSGIAPWPGSTTRSAARTSSGSRGHDDLEAAAWRPTCMHRLRHRAQVAHAVVDDGDRSHRDRGGCDLERCPWSTA